MTVQFDTEFSSGFARGTGWPLAWNAIATVLRGISITDPISASIIKVYPYRNQTETDFPCVVMPNPPGKTWRRGPGGFRERFYVVPLELLVTDADAERAAQILDSFEEAIGDAFDAAVSLGVGAGSIHIVEGPNWEPGKGSIPEASAASIVTGSLMLNITEAKNYIG